MELKLKVRNYQLTYKNPSENQIYTYNACQYAPKDHPLTHRHFIKPNVQVILAFGLNLKQSSYILLVN